MALSYALVHLIAFLISATSLRHHAWGLMLSSSFLRGRTYVLKIRFVSSKSSTNSVMSIIGPLTLGVLTSGSIALPFAVAGKSIGSWHCMIMGCGQTLLV